MQKRIHAAGLGTVGLACRLVLLVCLSGQSAGAVEILFDYSYDTSNFFADPQRRTVLEAAGRLVDRLADRLLPIQPGDSGFGFQNRFTAIFSDPATGETVELRNLQVPEDTLVIFAGGRSMPGTTVANGGPGGFTAAGTPDFLTQASRRGQGVVDGSQAQDVAPWGGNISFDLDASWSFSLEGPEPGLNDFFSTALHELGHVLGLGTSDAWESHVDQVEVAFTGTQVVESFGQKAPLAPDFAHWQNGTQSRANGQSQEAALDPSLSSGTRKLFTDLDMAALSDIGWQVAPLGDADLDMDVDSSDFNTLILSWTGAGEPFVFGRHFYEGDFDGDWDVDAADLATVITGWTGSQLAAHAPPQLVVPEPSSTALAALFGCVLWYCQKRGRRSVGI